MLKWHILCVFLWCNICLGQKKESEPAISVIFPKALGRDQKNSYPYQLIGLALEKAKVKAEITLSKNYISDEVAHLILSKNEKTISVMYSGTRQVLEDTLLPVRIPIFGGLLGYRLFFINKNDELQFSQIKTLKDLQKKVAGQGKFWPDVSILRAAQLQVRTAPYHQLFKWVQQREIDYFPRGISEIFGEYERRKNEFPLLSIEPNIILVYPLTSFYFVSRQNPELHALIERGLKQAHRDGSFKAFFNDHPETQKILKRSNIKQRIKIHINNPELTHETRNIPRVYWYNDTW
ncbi:MAG: hypothetical protein AAGB12_11695 [Pseudomonadota bacterium]